MNKIPDFSDDKIFFRLLNNKSAQNYWNYISELRKRKSKAIFDKSVALMKSEIVKQRIIGIDILGQFGYPRRYRNLTLKAFFNLLKTEYDEHVISSLLYGIGHNNETLSDKQIEFICSFKSHTSSSVRNGLVFVLMTKQQPKAIETLIELSCDRDSDIRDWATFGIGSQIETDNDAIRNALWKRISDKEEAVRFEAIFGLATRKDIRIKEVLIKELESIDEYGSLILEAIEAFNDKACISLIEKQIFENKGREA